ncbi:MAG: bifunctional diaminohydroxyphosphoribosylaminopyrimidine deaminase/5-amino-6-(5-phosphoribosylamino)uracil reductase RibD [Pyrinomonadaceae bacterium]|nr:bifunctional diaminohydroxyphosphoribosylaminopyrimidine deaminase/5-amino-6-(5-phosphoribosylamino)uracil reductase RibD [Pyrinomonadaceae bacterium]MCX7639220.1 bifunctional diaminohydroxyphosphoribosylaminopyrimidine deaminase/5-amino-6-(5-phosphoribosylamino)uracil reductase RibD [Pyrinomonadaceae bacterium]MDW8303558.1 bifunctional diaminohydroxyphosphoribosylaminopyrimidine deaminase/5-amino-6-(5-phosphoribosylamino)uracil reductase RibD [Acidobacteriota bacterium]
MGNFSEFDLKMTRRALELAALGVGQVSPNPLVGCVIVDKNGQIVGEGTYIYDNVVHAEVIALEQAGEKARGGTAYISLEPHAHTGRTPPCTDALIKAGIKRVVCPIEDPNPLVSGRGFKVLREHQIEVVTGILAEEAHKLNEKFFVWHRKKRPFVHLKMALSLDGRISLNRTVSTTLSSQISLKRVHELRHEHDAILVGSNTVITDNPLLTDRSGRPRRRPLVRIVLDNRLRIPLNSRIVETAKDFPTIVFSNSEYEEKIKLLAEKKVKVLQQDARNLHKVLKTLYSLQIQSVLVEGGAKIAGAFVDSRLIDKVSFIYSPLIVGRSTAPVAVEGRGADSLETAFRLKNIDVKKLGEDVEITGYPTE